MSSINVMKFGGTSMGSAQAMLQSAQISVDRQAKLVVVSAMSGVTNELIELARAAEVQNQVRADEALKLISEKHFIAAENLKVSQDVQKQLVQSLQDLKDLSRGIYLLQDCSLKAMDQILSFGERLSSLLFSQAIQNIISSQSTHFSEVKLLDARQYIKTDGLFGRARPQISEIQKAVQQGIALHPNIIYVTQGFIGSTEKNETTTLGRGGSDYTAALFAEALGAHQCEIWTDVAGIATTDPRISTKAQYISEITFQEMSELATFGAKVLHPATLLPAVRKNIPIFVANTFHPEQGGTWVRKNTELKPLVRAVALRKKQSLLTISTPEMLQAHGFLFQIFKVFNDYQISVDSITTSEISVAITIDNSTPYLQELVSELSRFADVQIESDLSLVSLIGNQINQTPGLAKKIFESVSDINVRMICLGASKHNFCFLVNQQFGEVAVQRLHDTFIETTLNK